jgi:phosphoribosylaminoimidazole carboxylase (NCAIR synthetase)
MTGPLIAPETSRFVKSRNEVRLLEVRAAGGEIEVFRVAETDKTDSITIRRTVRSAAEGVVVAELVGLDESEAEQIARLVAAILEEKP